MTAPGSPALIRVSTVDELTTTIPAHGISLGRPVLVGVGGAAHMSEEHSAALRDTLTDDLAPALDQWGASVVDGGTDSGFMRLLGQAKSVAGAGFPLIGVAAIGNVDVPGEPRPSDDAAPLEPHHTHVVLVPGTQWGDESPWLSAVAGVIAAGRPSVTLLVNGGSITMTDAEACLADGRPLIVLAGTGRAADTIAAAATDSSQDTRAVAIARSPLTSVVDALDARGIVDAVGAVLTG